MIKAHQSVGHTISAPHIEEPVNEFMVAWNAPPYINVMYFQACERWCYVRAKTREGALRVARYHYSRGENFRLLGAE